MVTHGNSWLIRRLGLLGLLSIGLSGLGRAANVVTDPSFEAQNPAWVFTDGAFFDNFDPAHTGSVTGVLSSCCGFFDGSISQTVNTVPGQTYLIDYWVATNSNWSGGVAVLFDNSFLFSQFMGGAQDYTEYQFSKAASGPTATFRLFSNSFFGTLFLDDVSIDAVTSTTPEPGSMLLLAAGIAALLVKARRAARRTVV
jgi:flagellin